MTAPQADGAAPASEPTTSSGEPLRPSARAVIGWIVLIAVGAALDGLVGGLTVVAVAAVLLAGLSTRLIGGAGVVLLLLVPVAIIIEGLPANSEISPEIVTRSLLPHHLAFAGLILVCAFALIDLAPHLRAWASAERAPQDDGPPLGTVVGALLVAAVVVGAILACRAVLSA